MNQLKDAAQGACPAPMNPWQLRPIIGLAGFALFACGGRAIVDGNAGGTVNEGASDASQTASGPDSGTPSSAGGSSIAEPDAGMPTTSDPGSASCTGFSPCGGSLDGTWQFDDACASPAMPFAEPAFCGADHVTTRISGTLLFAGGYRVIPITNYVSHHDIPASCVSALGGCGAPRGMLASCTPSANSTCACESLPWHQNRLFLRPLAGDEKITAETASWPEVQALSHHSLRVEEHVVARGVVHDVTPSVGCCALAGA